jgi:hypothetical protein
MVAAAQLSVVLLLVVAVAASAVGAAGGLAALEAVDETMVQGSPVPMVPLFDIGSFPDVHQLAT